MTKVTLDNLTEFPEVPGLNPPIPLPDCDICRGWGVVLGTDSPDSWGDPCLCGHAFVLFNAVDSQALHAAHMQRRLYPLVVR